jgi:uncharacterized protein
MSPMIEIIRLVWDAWNIAHIARHQVTPNEVEELCQSDCLVLDGHSGRIIVVGLTQANRLLAAVLDPEEEAGVYYPVTARTADRKERRLYQVEKGGEYDKAA